MTGDWSVLGSIILRLFELGPSNLLRRLVKLLLLLFNSFKFSDGGRWGSLFFLFLFGVWAIQVTVVLLACMSAVMYPCLYGFCFYMHLDVYLYLYVYIFLVCWHGLKTFLRMVLWALLVFSLKFWVRRYKCGTHIHVSLHVVQDDVVLYLGLYDLILGLICFCLFSFVGELVVIGLVAALFASGLFSRLACKESSFFPFIWMPFFSN